MNTTINSTAEAFRSTFEKNLARRIRRGMEGRQCSRSNRSTTTVVVYCRTARGAEDINNASAPINEQFHKLRRWAENKFRRNVNIVPFEDDGCSGLGSRPGLRAAMHQTQRDERGIFIVQYLSRIGLSGSEVMRFVEQLIARRWRSIAVEEQVDTKRVEGRRKLLDILQWMVLADPCR